jgi:hypothetical protein
MTKKRKRNRNAGLTKAQTALANKILTERIHAYYAERASGTMGLPGSMWEICADGRANCRGAPVREIVAGWQATSKWQ